MLGSATALETVRGPTSSATPMLRLAIKESKAIEFRWETYNTFNHTQFDRVRRSFDSSDFLTATTAHDARIMQFALKFLF